MDNRAIIFFTENLNIKKISVNSKKLITNKWCKNGNYMLWWCGGNWRK